MLILLILLLLIFGVGGGYYGNRTWGEQYGPYPGFGVGIGTILIILLVCYVLGII